MQNIYIIYIFIYLYHQGGAYRDLSRQLCQVHPTEEESSINVKANECGWSWIYLVKSKWIWFESLINVLLIAKTVCWWVYSYIYSVITECWCQVNNKTELSLLHTWLLNKCCWPIFMCIFYNRNRDLRFETCLRKGCFMKT